MRPPILATLLLLFSLSCDSQPTDGRLKLQGGIEVVLELSPETFILDMVRNPNNKELLLTINKTRQDIDSGEKNDFISAFVNNYDEINPGWSIVKIFQSSDHPDLDRNSTNKEIEEFLHLQYERSFDVTREILAARIDRLSVASPTIQKDLLNQSIIIELPGLKDAALIQRVVSSRGSLEILEVPNFHEYSSYLMGSPTDSSSTEGRLITEFLNYDQTTGGFPVSEKDKAAVVELLEAPENADLLPNEMQFKWSSKEMAFPMTQNPEKTYVLYVVKKPYDNFITSGDIQHAQEDLDQYSGSMVVTINMTAMGAEKWEQMTQENVGRHLAICLDDLVYSCPIVHAPIYGGSTQISGNFTSEEAKELAMLLNVGELPNFVKLSSIKVIPESN